MIVAPVTVADVFRHLRLCDEWVRWARPFEGAWATAVASCEDTTLLFALYAEVVEAGLAPPERAVLCGCEQARLTLLDPRAGALLPALELAEAACRGGAVSASDLVAVVRQMERLREPALTRPSEYAVLAASRLMMARETRPARPTWFHALAVRGAADVWTQARPEALAITHRWLGAGIVEGGRALGEAVLREEGA